ncbi:MAG: hypothetical protein M1576_03345 [Deltaproteobacteria bacterium]|jgi:chromosome segregation ATPase|nr:hypothetical protein [Deltaproteobacteria bacterium]
MNESTEKMKENKDKNSFSYPNEMLTFISGVFPNAKYFDARFDLLQNQIDEIRRNQELDRNQIRDFKNDVDRRFSEVDKKFELVDKRFEQVDKRFEQVDKRFEQVNKRFEQVDNRFDLVDKRFDQVDKRFEQMIASIDKLGDKLEYRDRDQRNFTIKMFSIAIAVSMLGVLGAFLKIIGVF